MNEQVLLRINGQQWGGWTSVRIAAGIERVARDFSVEITHGWPGYDAGDERPISVGDKVEVLIGDDPVMTGWIESTPLRYDATAVGRTISGRSLTCDLIDCVAEPLQFREQSLVQIARALAAPFDVAVVNAGVPDTLLQGVQPSAGETVMAVLNKLLEQQQALAFDDAQGRLVLGRVGEQRATTALVLGDNILSAEATNSVSQRFSVYRVSGQRAGNDEDFGDATLTALQQSASDAQISRYRPLMIRQTGNATAASCQTRANFEAQQRAARSRQVTYRVQGWRQGDGQLWQPNQQVIVWDPLLGFDNQPLLLAEVTFTLDTSGSKTTLTLAPPDAYLPAPAP